MRRHKINFHIKDSGNEPSSNNWNTVSVLLDSISKFTLPASILIIFVLYKPTFEKVFLRTKEATFLGNSIKFGTANFSINLSLLELYYLTATTVKKGDTVYLNNSALTSTQKAALYSLESKKLVKTKVEQEVNDTTTYGSSTLLFYPTDAGRKVIGEIGLNYK